MKTWMIEFTDPGGPNARLNIIDHNGRQTDVLTLGEVFEQITFMHMQNRERYPMRTEQQEEIARNRSYARRNEITTNLSQRDA